MFANLVSTNANKTRSNLSLLERQKQLQQEKSKQEQEQGNKFGNEAAFWDNLGSGKSTPQPSAQVMPPPPPARHDEDDLLAAFNSAAPVDKASHFPPPTASSATSGRSTPAVNKPTSLLANDDDDDDPFGLGAAPQRRPSPYQPAPSPSIDNNDDDDILGDLGKPVVAKPPQREPVDELFAIPARHSPQPSDPLDRPIAELVDMGFPVDKSRTALKETGGDVQSAVGWLLNQAHQESRNTSQTGSRDRSQVRSSARASPAPQSRDEPRRGRDHADAAAMPAWMRQESRPGSHQRKQDNASPATADKDVAAYAQDIGSSFLKSAGSLWKTGQKNLKKAVAEFQQEGDSSTPKWMRDASTDSASARSSTPRLSAPTRTAEDLTNEAMLLEARDDRRRPTPEIRESASRPDSRVRSPAQHLPIRSQPEPRFAQPPPPQQRPNTKFSRFDVDQESSQAYVSSARRRRPEPKSQPPPEPEVDLFSPAPVQSPSEPEVDLFSPAPPKPSSTPRVTTSKASTSIPQAPRPRAPPRNIPAISPSALSSSSNHRQAGTDAYKRGDYDAAHTCYSSALGCLPPNHPLLIIVLCNRALTAIKTGDPKAAVTDAETALQLIGPFKGENETINLGNNEGEKEMKEFYGKAVMRKAEALENMEKWSEAASVWKDAVAAGVGGAVSLRARDRCERAAANTSTSSTTCKPAPTFSKPAVRPPGKLAQPPQSQEAVRKLRAANAAADAADDEKFALSDQVEAKISNWKNGKSDNLRALLASLDTILWDEAGWKKVNMSDLIIANKVKIVYMKAIAKVHPDKVCGFFFSSCIPNIFFFFFFFPFFFFLNRSS
jgi:tetratricopeptide (TPR) repeat protein